MLKEIKRLTDETLTLSEAREVQLTVKERLVTGDMGGEIRTVGGSDLGVIRAEKRLVSGIVVFTYPGLEEIERVYTVVEESFPYIPGYLSFREGPAILKSWEKLVQKPDLLMLDGHGIAHPRGLGIASHIGAVLGVRSIGVAKKRLYGRYEEPAPERGAFTDLVNPKTGEIMGAVLRTRTRVKPVFVSPGNGVSVSRAVEITLACGSGYRLPLPTREADRYVGAITRSLRGK